MPEAFSRMTAVDKVVFTGSTSREIITKAASGNPKVSLELVENHRNNFPDADI